MNSKGARWALMGALLTFAAMGGMQPVLAQKMPDPSDEKALYELARKEGQVVFYHGGPEDPMRQVANAFQTKYPGISVSTIRAVGVRVYQRFEQETKAGQHLADVVHFSDYPTMQLAVDSGLYADWKVPTFDRFIDVYKIKQHAYAVYLNDVVIAYNTNKVTPEEAKLLTDWRSLADPRFKGRVALNTAACATCYGWIALFLDPRVSGYGKEALAKIGANQPGVFAENAQALDRVVAGEYDITTSLEGLTIPLFQKGAPIRWIHPNPTPLIVAPMPGVSATAPHPAAARLFLNWMTSDDGAKAMQNLMGSIISISDHPDERPVVKETWYSPISHPYQLDMKRWNDHYDDEMALWQDILKKGQRSR